MSRFDRFTVLAVTAVAALLRLPGIDARGRFDADQGHDMLTLMAFTRDGVWPLLGAKVSVGDLHQGAAYYYVLAPAAWISNDDPVVVTAWIALMGIGAVALTWWVARAIGGPVAGALAGLLLAISPAAIESSTFIWNPNLIPLFAALALGAAWKAHASQPVASPMQAVSLWALAIGSAGLIIQLHLLGVVFFIAILGLALIEVRRTRTPPIGVIAGLTITALLFTPLVVHEVQTGFVETRNILHYIRAGDGATSGDPLSTVLFTLLRIVGWPLVGLVTDVPVAAAVLLAVVVGLVAIGIFRARGEQRTALWWLVGLLVWSTLALAFAAPSLQTVVAGLPNDHYHAFVDPIVIILIAVPVADLFEAALAAWRANPAPGRAALPVLVGLAVLLLAIGMLSRNPPQVDPYGGWSSLKLAGERVATDVGGGPVVLTGIPDFKTPDAVGFPLAYAGVALQHGNPPAATHLVLVCDRLFEPVIGLRCGGPAEGARVPPGQLWGVLVDRFDASPRTVVSVYEVASP